MEDNQNTSASRRELPAGTAFGYFLPAEPPEGRDDRLTLAQLSSRVWNDKWMVIAITVLMTLLAALAAFTMTPIYRAQAILAPVDTSDPKAGVLGALGAFGSLTSAVGLGTGLPVANKDEAIAILRSRAFTEQFVQDNNLLPILFEEDWDAAAKSWRVTEPDEVPTSYRGFKLIQEKLRTISVDSASGLVTLAIEWKDPDLAAQWVDEHIRRVNDIMRARAVADAEKSLAFLNAELAGTNVVEVRQAIFSVIEGQYKSMTLANTREEFIFKVVDPALPPVESVRPKKLLMIAGGMVAGGLLGIAFVLFRPRRLQDHSR